MPKAFGELASSGLSTAPFDALTSFFVISLLQKYGQNERSVFSFLNAEGPGSPGLFEENFYSSQELVTYAVERQTTIPDKLLWEASERAIQRADSHAGISPRPARIAIRTVLLANIFGREGSAFDLPALKSYLACLVGKKRLRWSIILSTKTSFSCLRHKGKVVFVEGTDVNLLNELRIARKKLSSDIDFGAEVMKRVQVAPRLSRGHFIDKGTPRFFHFSFHHPSLPNDDSMRLGNGICHVFLEESQPQWGIERGFPEVSAIIQDHKHLLELERTFCSMKSSWKNTRMTSWSSNSLLTKRTTSNLNSNPKHSHSCATLPRFGFQSMVNDSR